MTAAMYARIMHRTRCSVQKMASRLRFKKSIRTDQRSVAAVQRQVADDALYLDPLRNRSACGATRGRRGLLCHPHDVQKKTRVMAGVTLKFAFATSASAETGQPAPAGLCSRTTESPHLHFRSGMRVARGRRGWTLRRRLHGPSLSLTRVAANLSRWLAKRSSLSDEHERPPTSQSHFPRNGQPPSTPRK